MTGVMLWGLAATGDCDGVRREKERPYDLRKSRVELRVEHHDRLGITGKLGNRIRLQTPRRGRTMTGANKGRAVHFCILCTSYTYTCIDERQDTVLQNKSPRCDGAYRLSAFPSSIQGREGPCTLCTLCSRSHSPLIYPPFVPLAPQ